MRALPMLVMPVPVPSGLAATVPRSRFLAARTSSVPGPPIWRSPASGRASALGRLPGRLAAARSGELALAGTMSRAAETMEKSEGMRFWR